MPSRPGLLPTALLLGSAIYILYFEGLAATGLVGPDEPRYASIGREIARSGDWITPRLWGEPWFEKPVLLYWMIAAATRAGPDAELAARLPVAMLAVAFLGFFYWRLRVEFEARAAAYAAAILATSAGWLGVSRVAITDLPLAAFLSAGLLLALGWLRGGDGRLLPWASALLGLAILAKGLLPFVFVLPLIWCGRRRLTDLLRPRVWLPCLAVAAPWYVLCYSRNGWPFIQEFFVEHHFGRFASAELQHVQPFWFYLPVILAALFPWTAALAPAARIRFRGDPRRVFLLLWVMWGLIFLSAARNKLPGYVLPLLPPLAALGGIALAEARSIRWVAVGAPLLLCLVAPLASVLPQALAGGLSRAQWPGFQWAWTTPALAALPLLYLEARQRRAAAVAVLAAATVVQVVWLKAAALPAIEELVSARPLWRQIAARRDEVCVESMHRSWRYGLNYYSVTPLPDCDAEPRAVRITQEDSSRPVVRMPE